VRRCNPAAQAMGGSTPAGGRGATAAAARAGLEAIATSAIAAGQVSAKSRMTIRHVCAVRMQSVARGMLVRLRLQRWRRRAEAPAAASAAVHAAGDAALLEGGSLATWLPMWVVRPSSHESVRGGRGREGGGGWEEVVDGLKTELEQERAARRKQDDALRVLWREVGRLRTAQESKAAVLIQKMWRGHDDRALYSVARAHFRAYKAAREKAARAVQRAARRCFASVFGELFLRRWRASLHVQVLFFARARAPFHSRPPVWKRRG